MIETLYLNWSISVASLKRKHILLLRHEKLDRLSKLSVVLSHYETIQLTNNLPNAQSMCRSLGDAIKLKVVTFSRRFWTSFTCVNMDDASRRQSHRKSVTRYFKKSTKRKRRLKVRITFNLTLNLSFCPNHTYFEGGIITLQLTSFFTDLHLTKQVNMLIILA